MMLPPADNPTEGNLLQVSVPSFRRRLDNSLTKGSPVLTPNYPRRRFSQVASFIPSAKGPVISFCWGEAGGWWLLAAPCNRRAPNSEHIPGCRVGCLIAFHLSGELKCLTHRCGAGA